MVLKYFVDRLRNDFLLLYQVCRLDVRIFLLNKGLDTVNKVGIEQIGATLLSNALQHGFELLLSATPRLLWIFRIFFSEGNFIKHDVHCQVISHDLVLVLLAVVQQATHDLICFIGVLFLHFVLVTVKQGLIEEILDGRNTTLTDDLMRLA